MPLSPARAIALRVFRYALHFDGVDDYVSVPDSPSLRPQFFTISLWISSLETRTDDRTPLSKFISTAVPYASYLIHQYKGLLTFGTGDTGDVWDRLDVGVDLFTKWDNVVAVYDGSYKVLYLNSSELARKAYTRTIKYEAQPLYLACWYPGLQQWSGRIAQVLIHNRALSPSERQWNYNCPHNPVRNGLVLWLYAHPDYVKDIDGDGVLEWIDLSGHGNHGKIYGARLVELIKPPAR